MKTSVLIHPSELSKTWVDRLVAHGITTLGIHPEGGEETAESLRNMLELLQKPQTRELLDYAKSRGLRIEYEIHAFSYLLDRRLFSEHPEYFRMDEQGNRTADKNFCPSSPQALAMVAENAVKLADALYGSEEVYFFWQDDVRSGACQCEQCRGLSASDQQMTALNAMLRAIRKKRPKATMAYLAYYGTLDIPAVRPEEGIFLEYAPFDKWRRKPGQQEKYAAEIRREREARKPLLEFFGKKDSRVLEYWIDNSMFSGWKKPPKKLLCDGAEVRRDVAEYLEMGFENISVFGCYLGEDYEALHGEPDISPFTDVLK